MPRAMSVCSRVGCPTLVEGSGRCAQCKAEAEKKRGTASQRGYGGRSWSNSRKAVVARDRQCVCTDEQHDHAAPCGAPSKVADHYPVERKDLLAAGVEDPDAPHRMRGVCKGCHDKKTAAATPGGWNLR